MQPPCMFQGFIHSFALFLLYRVHIQARIQLSIILYHVFYIQTILKSYNVIASMSSINKELSLRYKMYSSMVNINRRIHISIYILVCYYEWLYYIITNIYIIYNNNNNNIKKINYNNNNNKECLRVKLH